MSLNEKVLILLTLAFQFVLSYLVLNPEVGYDDANITQAYARNIADGYGYVYNIGGERVEGSTSALWTLLNTVAFLTPAPLLVIQILCIGIVTGVLVMSVLITKALTDNQLTPKITILLFNLFPSVFGWGFFSFMDITLFILLIAVAIYLLHTNKLDKPSVSLLILVALIPLTRPEGLLVSFAIFVFWRLFYVAKKANWTSGLSVVYTTICTFALITGLRLLYFGYPFPNTYYAKTSSDTLGQILQGTEYTLDTLLDEWLGALLIVTFIAVLFILRGNNERQKKYTYLAILLVLGSITTYVYLGGDYFAGGRFYQFLIPLLLPLVAICLVYVRSKLTESIGNSVFACVALFLFWITTVDYVTPGVTKFDNPLRVAKNERATGQHLEELFGGELSVSVIAAGGIRMTYSGMIYDLLGLNWTEMAHSYTSDTSLAASHGGFNPDLFMRTKPDIFAPYLMSCEIAQTIQYLLAIEEELTKNITDTQEFSSLYQIYCDEVVTMYALRSLDDVMLKAGMVPLNLN